MLGLLFEANEQRPQSGLCERVIRREATETEGLVSLMDNCFCLRISTVEPS